MILLHAIPISAFLLALFYYWFAVADRYVIFLYGHMNAQPFDEVTIGRYWMSGLVASGFVLIVYNSANALLGHFHKRYSPPAWWRIWLACAIPLIIGIPLITMTQNSPTLPPALAALCALVALIGLALALMPTSLAARRPADFVWLALDGIGIAAVLQLFWAIELPSRLPSISTTTAYLVSFGSIMFSVVWLVAMGILRAWRHVTPPHAFALFIAGLCWSYLALPLAHHLFATPAAYRYITTSSNFFSSNLALQLLTWIIAAGLAVGAVQLRKQPNRFWSNASHLAFLLLPFRF